MWYIYILETDDGRLYTGATNDVDRRFSAHQKGQGAKFTRIFGCKKLLYTESSRKLTVIMDTKLCDNMAKLAKDADILIVESSYLSEDEEKAEAYFHMTAQQDAQVAKKANVKKLILTHPCQKYDLIPKALIKDAKESFDGEIIVAEDFMKFEL